ncbi:MAG: T9SS type A sorting domain-containing protein [Bacteroidetes bacterium]|nr:T9SS type A sorting domain-containing protein [Bacteroidota bacterium]
MAYELSKNQKGLVIVYDILGREQMKIDLHSDNNKVSINVSLLKQGLYTYKYLVNNRQQITGKLLIQ